MKTYLRAAARMWPETCLALGVVLMSMSGGAALILGGLW